VASCSRVGPLVSNGWPRLSSHRRVASAVSAAVRVVRPAARARLPGRLEMMTVAASLADALEELHRLKRSLDRHIRRDQERLSPAYEPGSLRV
jgi:hypothetical protein